jgi:hypothetical protein
MYQASFLQQGHRQQALAYRVIAAHDDGAQVTNAAGHRFAEFVAWARGFASMTFPRSNSL